MLTSDRIAFTGAQRARKPSPWPDATFKKSGWSWVPVRRSPVRYTDTSEYSSLEEFCGVCLDRLVDELGNITALEVFSSIYAAVHPCGTLIHADILALLDKQCVRSRKRTKWHVYTVRPSCGPPR